MRSTHLRRYPTPARTYYVDATAGADTNSGAADKPLQTLAAVNALALRPGDRVLFKRGETWTGQGIVVPASGRPGRPIYYGAYGVGANPVIDGTTIFTDWIEHSAPVYKRAHAAVDTQQIFEGTTRLTYAAAVAGMPAGSWCYVSNVEYVRCTDDGDPNTRSVRYSYEAGNTSVALNGKSWLVFDSIDCTRYNWAGYNTDVAGTSNVLIKNCTGSWGGSRFCLIGVTPQGTTTNPTDVTIENCIGHDNLDVPFWLGRGTRLSMMGCEAYYNGKDVNPEAKNYPIAKHFPNGVLVSGGAIDCVVRRCYIHDNYAGGTVLDETSPTVNDHSVNTLIEGNLIVATGYNVPAVKICGTGTTFRNNIIYHDSNSGVCFGLQLLNAPTNTKIYHNTFVSSGAACLHSIYALEGTGTLIKNNLFISARTSTRIMLIGASAKTGIAINNNCYYQSTGTLRLFWGPDGEQTSLANWRTVSGQDAQGMVADPVVVTANTDLHLQTTSPCKAAGDATVGVLTDYDSVVRGVAVDIGAYEYV